MITAEELVAPPTQQQARRQRVIQTAIELAAQHGYDGLRMGDVPAVAGVAVGTVYRLLHLQGPPPRRRHGQAHQRPA